MLHPIQLTYRKKEYRFEVGEFSHFEGQRCKFNVYSQGKLVASFTPDRYQILQLCKNYGNLSTSLLNLIADQIEGLSIYGHYKRFSATANEDF